MRHKHIRHKHMRHKHMRHKDMRTTQAHIKDRNTSLLLCILQGVVYITDETSRHEITSWRLEDGGETLE